MGDIYRPGDETIDLGPGAPRLLSLQWLHGKHPAALLATIVAALALIIYLLLWQTMIVLAMVALVGVVMGIARRGEQGETISAGVALAGILALMAVFSTAGTGCNARSGLHATGSGPKIPGFHLSSAPVPSFVGVATPADRGVGRITVTPVRP